MTTQRTVKAGQNPGQSVEKSGGNPPTSNPKLKQMSQTQLTKGEKMLKLQTRPPVILDLSELEERKVDRRVLARGVELKKKGRVHPNPLYPWRFLVSGDEGKTGTNAYVVDLSTLTCPCLYAANSPLPCKHMIAALLTHMEREGG